MPDPTPERIAAALALAEACEARVNALNYIERNTAEHHLWNVAFPAYRATAPKPLRTRAEVDAEIVELVRLDRKTGRGCMVAHSTVLTLDMLCAEPTAEAEPGTRCDVSRFGGGRCVRHSGHDGAHAYEAEPNRVTDHDADQRPHPYGPSSEDSADSSLLSAPAAGATFSDVEACSCEESEALKAEIAVLRAKISDCANHAQSGLGHGKYPSCSAETACRWIYQRLTNP